MNSSAGKGIVKPRVFLSYSRVDKETAEWLRNALLDEGFDAYLDVHDIAMGEAWRTRLQDLIATAEKVVFLISPSAVASDICAWEVEQAEQLGKTILPVVCRETENDAIPDRLSRLNFTFMRDDEERATHLAGLVSSLRLDLPWEREKARITDDAVAWDQASRPNRLLLFSKDAIREAEIWRDGRPPLAPALTEVQTSFIDESRIRRSTIQRRVTILSAVVACITAIAAVYAVIQGQRAIASEKVATTRAAILSAGTAGDLAETGSTDGALLLLLDAAQSFDEETVPDALLIGFDRALRHASGITRYALPATTQGHAVPGGLLLHDATSGKVSYFDGTSAPEAFGTLPGKVMALEPTTLGPGMLAVLFDGQDLSVALIDPKLQTVKEVGRVPGLPPGSDTYAKISSSGVVFVNSPPWQAPGSLVFDSQTGKVKRFDDQLSNYGEIATDSAGGNYLLPSVAMDQNSILKLGEDFRLTPVKTDQDIFARLRFDHCMGSAVSAPQVTETRANFTSDELHSLFVWTGSSMFLGTTSYGELTCHRKGDTAMVHLNVLTNRFANRRTNLLEFGSGVPIFHYQNATAKSANISAYWQNEPGEREEEPTYTIADPKFSDIRIFQANSEEPHPLDPLSTVSESAVVEAMVAPAPDTILTLRAAGVQRGDAPIDLRLAVYDLAQIQKYNNTIIEPDEIGSQQPLRPRICASSFSDPPLPDQISSPTGLVRIGVSGDGSDGDTKGYLEFLSPGEEVLSKRALDWSGNRSYSRCARLSQNRDWLIVQDGADYLVLPTSPQDQSGGDPLPRLSGGKSSVEFFAQGPALITTDATSGEIMWHSPSANSSTGWETEIAFSGRNQVVNAQSNADGSRLLIVESPDGPMRRGFVYSLDADRIWREVGEGFRVLDIEYLPEEAVSSGSGVGMQVTKLHSLTEAVNAAKATIAIECRPTVLDAWNTSPCWPAGY